MVTFILVMVLVSGRFIKYLAEAAAGEIAADALFLVMAFRMPEFLQMIVPLSLYIGLLLVLGRMHMDNEMVVLQAGGQGHIDAVSGLQQNRRAWIDDDGEQGHEKQGGLGIEGVG